MHCMPQVAKSKITLTNRQGITQTLSLTYCSTSYQARELGNPKVKKPKEVPPYYEACEPCKLYLDAGDEVPLPQLAKLIKFRLLAVKAADLKRREVDKKVRIIDFSCSLSKVTLVSSTGMLCC